MDESTPHRIFISRYTAGVVQLTEGKSRHAVDSDGFTTTINIEKSKVAIFSNRLPLTRRALDIALDYFYPVAGFTRVPRPNGAVVENMAHLEPGMVDGNLKLAYAGTRPESNFSGFDVDDPGMVPPGEADEWFDLLMAHDDRGGGFIFIPPPGQAKAEKFEPWTGYDEEIAGAGAVDRLIEGLASGKASPEVVIMYESAKRPPRTPIIKGATAWREAAGERRMQEDALSLVPRG